MKCHRCSSLMVYEKFYGSNSGSHEPFWGWRCIGCGEIVDRVILENRQYQAEGWSGREGRKRERDEDQKKMIEIG